MPTTLRRDVNQLTSDRIMRAVAELMQQGAEDLTFARVAAVSGIAERTLYRRYATKAALLEAFWRWLNEKIGTPPQPHSPADLTAQIPQLFAAFEAGAPLVRAMLHDRNGREARLGQSEARRQRLRVALGDVLASLAPKQRQKLLASVQLFASATGWESMKDNWGLTTPEAAEAAQWAITALVEAALASSRDDKRNKER